MAHDARRAQVIHGISFPLVAGANRLELLMS